MDDPTQESKNTISVTIKDYVNFKIEGAIEKVTSRLDRHGDRLALLERAIAKLDDTVISKSVLDKFETDCADLEERTEKIEAKMRLGEIVLGLIMAVVTVAVVEYAMNIIRTILGGVP